MVAPIRFLSGRQQQQKIGVEGSTEDVKVLEVVGRTGIGTTIFSPVSELDVRGTTTSIDYQGEGGDLTLGTPTGGSYRGGAYEIESTDKVDDSIDELNYILGKLVPSPPDNIDGVALSLTGTAGLGRLCADFTPTNNTGGDLSPLEGTQYARNTDGTITTDYITEYGPGDSGTVTGLVNDVSVGSTTLKVSFGLYASGSDNGTYGALQIANDKDAADSSRNVGITSLFYEVYDARLIDAASPAGFNKAQITQGSEETQKVYWYEDPSTVAAPIITFSDMSEPSSGSHTVTYSSGVPHYTQSTNNNFSYTVTVTNASGDMYTQDKLLNSDGQTAGFQNPGHRDYDDFTGGTLPPIQNYGVGTGVDTTISQTPRDLHLTLTSNHFTRWDAVTPYGSHNNQRISYSNNINIMGTTARTDKIDEDNILISSLGSGSGNATRVNAGSTGDNPIPVFTSWTANSSVAAYESVVRGAVLRHDQTDYSTGYLPVGPDYSSGRTGAQYFQMELIRSAVPGFSISVTGTYGGCWVCMPDNSSWTTGLSNTNGWADMFIDAPNSGVPRNDFPGCAIGGVMTGNSGTFNCTFGGESSSNDGNNRILVRWRLDSGDSITAMSFSAT